MIKLFFLTTALLLPCFCLHANESVAYDRRWLNLGHYKKTWFGTYKSESLKSHFFLSPEGHRSPTLELQATLEGFKQAPVEDINQHPICRFPARARFLEKTFPEDAKAWPKLECDDYQKFYQRLNAKAVSLVFSSYFLDTPASAFGHTLLRFSKNPHEQESERYELLDYAANYSAVVTTGNALLYAALGITGGFLGEFAVMPYFYKVREYNDFESRDIWDYELNLTQEQLDQLIAHLFEMKWARFPYYYLSHNCSYHMLSLLDVAHPDWHLTDRLGPFVIPVDTIRAVAETPNLVRTVRFRPSKRKILEERLNRISSHEQSLVRQSLKERNPDLLKKEGQEPKTYAAILDAAIDSIDFLKAQEMVQEDPETLSWKRRFLIARSKVDAPDNPVNYPLPEKERPDSGHESGRLSIGVADDSKFGLSTSLEYRFALHDFIDPLEGHNPGSSMEMGRIRVRYNHEIPSQGDRSLFWLDEFALVEVRSLSPLTSFFKAPSWRAYLGAQTLRDQPFHGLLSPTAQLAGGYSLGLGKTSLFYLFAQSAVQQHKKLSASSFRLNIGPEAGLILRTQWRINFMIFGRYDYHFISKANDKSWHYGIKSKIKLKTNWTLNFEYHDYDYSRQTEIGTSFYF